MSHHHALHTYITRFCNASPRLANFARPNRLYNIAQPSLRFLSGTIRQHTLTTLSAHKDVFLRLSSHEILHGLVRLNLPEEASILAVQMMVDGVPVRCKTLQAILRCLKEDPDHRRLYMPIELLLLLESSDVLTLRRSMLSGRAKFAFDLLMAARRSGQRRSRIMFEILIEHCIDNGNIIAASLLYGTLLKDWQAREPAGIVLSPIGKIIPHPNTPFPSYPPLFEICKSISKTWASDKSDADFQFAFKASLQALANLATMLNDQVIAHPGIGRLLTVMHKCPQVPDMVWIYDHSGNPKQIVAYEYFHEVLYQFIHSLPTHPSAPDERKKMLPPLGIRPYNNLLQYALRRQKSSSLAETILYHMIHERHEPLRPNIASLDIIVASKSLLESETADFALSKLDKDWKLLTAPIDSKSPSHSLLKEDKYILATHITHLTSTGQLHAVVDLLPIIFPTLTLPEDRKCSEEHEQDLHRSALLGPNVFICFLTALRKAGCTGLAEKVWKRAKMAEKMSWTVEVEGRVRPWCLPVKAYTILIEMYAAEFRKGPFNGKKVDRRMCLSTLKRPSLIRHVQIKGWGTPENDFPETGGPRTRSEIGCYLGMQIYRSMKNSPKAISLEIRKLQDQQIPISTRRKELVVPKPNARFFNAILDIVGRHPHIPPRNLRRGLRYYRRQYRKRYPDYVRKGIKAKRSDPNLLEVGRDMVAAGFTSKVPLSFRKFFVVGGPEDVGSLDSVELAKLSEILLPRKNVV